MAVALLWQQATAVFFLEHLVGRFMGPNLAKCNVFCPSNSIKTHIILNITILLAVIEEGSHLFQV